MKLPPHPALRIPRFGLIAEGGVGMGKIFEWDIVQLISCSDGLPNMVDAAQGRGKRISFRRGVGGRGQDVMGGRQTPVRRNRWYSPCNEGGCGPAAIPTAAFDPPHSAASPAVPALVGSGSPTRPNVAPRLASGPACRRGGESSTLNVGTLLSRSFRATARVGDCRHRLRVWPRSCRPPGSRPASARADPAKVVSTMQR